MSPNESKVLNHRRRDKKKKGIIHGRNQVYGLYHVKFFWMCKHVDPSIS